jgi:hypothetical protein
VADTDPLEEATQKVGLALLESVYGMTRVLKLYEANNRAVVRLKDRLMEDFSGFWEMGGQEVKLQLLAEEAFINGKLIRMDASIYEKATDLAAGLDGFGVGEIAITSGVTRDQLEAFTLAFAESMRSGTNQFDAAAHPDIRLAKASGRSMASFRFEPDRLAIWLYSSFLDLVGRLYSAHAAGETPSLLPVRRMLQLIIDTMRNHGGIFQLLTTIRDATKPLDRARLRAAIAVDSIGFGLFVGLGNVDIMTLALSGLLGGLSASDDPDEGVAPLFAYPGLGSGAMGLILCVHDTRKARLGQSAGVPGRMLAVIEAYQLLTAGTTESVPAGEALRRMAAGEVAGVERGPATVFLGYKGAYPLGSAVTLSDGSTAIVVSQGTDPDARDTPSVARYARGKGLSEDWLDLSKGSLSITDTPSNADAGVDLLST